MSSQSACALVGGVCGRRDHLVPDRGLRNLVRRHIEFDDLADASIPVHVVAFDVAEGRELLLSHGPAIEAIAAAAAVPGVFPPVEFAGRRLIDGGVANNTPISHAVQLGAERIFVLPTQDHRRQPARIPKTALDAAIYGLGLLIDSRLKSDIARYSKEAELIVLPAPNTTGVQPTSFEHSSRLMAEALVATRTYLVSQRLGRHLRLAM
jgi:NTE family protein